MSLLLSAASTALPDKKEISLSEDGPPIKTATFPNSLMRFPRFASTYNADGRLLRPPAPAAPQHRVGLAPSKPPPFRTRSCDSRVSRPPTTLMGGCFALPHRLLRSTESGSPHQNRHLSELAHAATPMIRTSGSRTTLVFSAPTSRTCAISASISDALAAPFGFPMKLARFSET